MEKSAAFILCIRFDTQFWKGLKNFCFAFMFILIINQLSDKTITLILLKLTYSILIEQFNTIQGTKNNKMLFCT